MIIDESAAQALAKQLGGTLEKVESAEFLYFPQPQEYRITLPSGAVVDAGAVAYSLAQSEPGTRLETIVGTMEVTALYAGGMAYSEAVAASLIAPPPAAPLSSPLGVPNAAQWKVIQEQLAQYLLRYGALLGVAQGGFSTMEQAVLAAYQARYGPLPQAGVPAATAGQTKVETHPGTTPGGGVEGVTPGYDPGASAMTVQAQIKAAANTQYLNADEWGFYYAEVTGTPAPAPEDLGYERPLQATAFDAWWARMETFAAGAPGTGGEERREEGAPQSAFEWFFEQLRLQGLAFLFNALMFGGFVKTRAE